MYCSACGTQLAPGLSFCSRCGMGLKERDKSTVGPISAFLTAITLIGIGGLGIILGGAVALTNGAHLGEELVGFFMLFSFVIVAITEILLLRQLSRFTAAKQPRALEAAQPLPLPADLRRAPAPRSLVEPGSSVTENTTRTLKYSANEPVR